ncbi:diphosphomevalonate decarboxylase isoform X1 [Phlebotomus papatasi]|uniref:diphosphomevalonate decarboxylase isoform X1 n=1 Tax=Phlebotomus papatasi TaxID=29031 RepID=UPI0024844588|nr:diphosphomevalonate decarboxylase isoform X1 [Phlebotomus papatasi]
MRSATCTAPVNIAVIKYWGKRDEELLLPINDSISVTLSEMYAKTTIVASPEFDKNRIWLNGEEQTFDSPRILNVLRQFREEVKKARLTGDIYSWNLHVCSENNFPTAAGLASSAAGYACLVYTLATLYGLQDRLELSSIARLGSGSACRSVYGGFVQWNAGTKPDGSDSIAVQLAPSTHWPDLEILILVVSDNRKKTSSTGGMERSVKTSPLIAYRASKCVPERIQGITKAIQDRDFETFADITMKDSNQFHAVCLDTYPPCVYLNDVSHAIIDLVHRFNAASGRTKVAYTFDAGPNACLYLLRQDVPQVLNLVKTAFPNDKSSSSDYLKGIPITEEPLPESLSSAMNLEPIGHNLLKYIIHTRVGEGPQILPETNSLLTTSGLPKSN